MSMKKLDSYKEFILEQFRELEGITCRSMFGAYGLYCEGTFFGIIANSRLYFKTDEKTRVPYIKYGMKPFRPTPKQTLKNYYEVPADIIEDVTSLTEWANTSLTV